MRCMHGFGARVTLDSCLWATNGETGDPCFEDQSVDSRARDEQLWKGFRIKLSEVIYIEVARSKANFGRKQRG